MTESEKRETWEKLMKESQETACFLYRMSLYFKYELKSVTFKQEGE